MTKGLDEILANLTKLEVKAPKTAKAAVTKVAKEFEKTLKSNTPVYEMKQMSGYKKIQLSAVLKALMLGLYLRKSVTVKPQVGVRIIQMMVRFTNKDKTLRKRRLIR